ncbi:helix-turn-helix domain-containing protein [Cyanobacteria bacterium FACHB-DQ100]|nr:helix-turn-helix domain-containing protein [Cyanobacteria bacterium FACHB-DQ100]
MGIHLTRDAIQKAKARYSSRFGTHGALAGECGLSESTVHRFFQGKAVSNESFQRICKALDLDPRELFYELSESRVRGENANAVRGQSPDEEEVCNFSNQGNGVPYCWKRTDDIDTLTTLITQPSTARLGIFGMGGIGKTVLALALTREPEVQQAFPDGIFLILCGQEQSPTSLQMQLVRALGGTPQPFVNDQEGRTFLRKQIGCKQCLVILDDVWRLEQIHAFDSIGESCRLLIGENCKLLITTQNQGLLTASGSEKYELELLNEPGALELLSLCSGQEDAQQLESAREVARECEGLPLALALCGMQIRDGNLWEDLRDALRASEIECLDHELGSVAKVLKVSVDTLIRKNAEDGRLYQMLAVFAKSTPIPEAAILTFWIHNSKLNKHRARLLITRLANWALLTVSREDGKRFVTLHGLQHNYLCSRLDDPLSLNDKLLEAYQQQCPTDWARGPNDGYYLEHLVPHLFKSGRDKEVYELLIGSFNWMQRKFKDCQGDTAYVVDLNLAISKLCDPLTSDQVLLLAQLYTARQVVTYRVCTYSDTDLRILVLLNRYDEALAIARLKPDAEQRFNGLVSIYDSLKEKKQLTHTLLDEMWETAREIECPYSHQSAQLQLQQILPAEEPSSNSEKAVTTSSQGISSSVRQKPTEKIINEDWIDSSPGYSDEERKQLKEHFNLCREVKNLTKKGCYETVESLIAQVPDLGLRASLSKEYATALIQAQCFSKAETTIEKTLTFEQQTSAFKDLVLALAQSGRLEEANCLFARAKSVAEQSPKDLKEVLEEHDDHLERTLITVIEGLATIGHVEEAGGIARRTNHPYWQAVILTSLLSSQVRLGGHKAGTKLLGEIKEMANQVSSCEVRSRVLQKAFQQTAELNFQVEANSFLVDLLDCIEEIEDRFTRAGEKSNLVKILAQLQRTIEAKELLRHIEHPFWYTIGLTHLAEADLQQAEAIFAEAFASLKGTTNIWSAGYQIGQSQKRVLTKHLLIYGVAKLFMLDQALRKVSINNFLISYLAKDVVPKTLLMAEIHLMADWSKETPPTEVRRNIASERARAQFFHEAFESLGFQTLEDFFIVLALAGWMPSFEKTERGLSLRILREVARIAGWISPEWMEISRLF